MSLKKGISIVLILAVVIFSMPLVGTAATAANWEDVLQWRTINGGTEIEIIGCNRNARGELVIPNEIEGVPVASIGDNAFSWCESLTSVTIPDGVTSIGDAAFAMCKSLTSITIPDNVTSIGSRTFSDCSSLTNITIPDSVTSIGDSAFSDCSSLTSITIPDSVTSIGDYAFYGCSSLKSVTIGSNVTSIGADAFRYCSSLRIIIIPESVTSIGNGAFSDCTSLKSVTIGNGVTSIGSYAFYYCSSLTSITIPDSVTSIGESAFYGCHNLTIYCYEDSYAHIYAVGRGLNYAFVALNSIEVKTMPTKTSYFVGDTLDTAGLTLTATYNNGVTEVISENFTYTPDELNTAGTQTITVTYGGKTTTFDVTVKAVELSSIAIKTNPTKTSYFVGDLIDTTGLTLTATYNNGVTEVISENFTYTPDELNTAGTQAVTVTYGGKTTTFDVTVTAVELSSIEVKTMPTKTSYFVGDLIDTTGLTLTATYNNGVTEVISENFTYTPDELNTAGTQTITVTYGGKTTTFDVTVKAVELSSIAIKTNPTKTSYFVGDTLDTAGLTLTATYNNGTTETVTNGFTCSPTTLSTAGTQKITVTYQGKTTTFNVTVKAVELSSIEVKTMPTKTSYFVGDLIDTTGLTLTATYNNGTTETVTNGFTCSPTKLNTAGKQTVTVTYGGKTTTFNVNVTAVELSSIAVKTNPTKTSYFVGDTLNTTGLTLTATYNNGTTQTISSGFTCSPTKLSTAGTQKITVTYQGKTTTFNVTVKAVELSSISVKTNPTKTSYFVGDIIDTTGLTLAASYNNGTTETISNGFTCSPTTLNTAGTQKITVTYGGKTTTFDVTVTAVELSSIEVKTMPTKTSYFVGDLIDTTGLTLTATYNNGVTEVISENFTYTPDELNTAGTQAVTVTYGGKTTTFDVTVTAVELSSIEVKTMPTKTSYFVGDLIDTTGLTLTATYNNGVTEVISENFTYTPDELNTAGTQTITVTYGGKTTTFDVTVKAVELSSIAIKTNPTKTSYFVGDTLDTAGLTLTATYNNGTTETVTNGFTCSPTTLSTAGTQKITVTYQGKTTTFNVTVKAVELSSIEVKTMPTKTSYFVGDLIDTTGLTLTATYNNGTTETVTNGFTCSPTKLSTAGTQAVTVTYSGKTTTFDVTVKAVELSSIAIKTNPTKTSYFVGDLIDTTGLTLTATYNNGVTEVISENFTYTPDELNTAGTQAVTVTYGGKTTTFDVTVKAVELSSIAIKTNPTKTSYFVGDALNTTGLTLTATYNNGVTEVISENFTYTPDELNTAGTQTITVTYGGKTTTFDVTVTAVELSSIEVKTMPTKTSYFVGDLIDTTGLTLTATYNNGVTEVISENFTYTPDELNTAGTQTITVTYGGKTTTFDVTVKAVELSSIAVKTNPTKTSYFVGDTLDTAGLTLTATYNNGAIETVTSGFTCSPTKLSTAGTQAVTVTYGGKTTTFNVNVTAVELSSITIKTNPTKTSYFVGDTLNTTGLTLTATYNNGVTEVISENFTYTPDELNTAGTQAVTVTYGGKTTTFDVTVTAVELSSIAVKTNPTKTSYFIGDTLDTAGLTLTATYNNGTTETVTNGFTCSPTTLSTAGTQKITVTYQGKTTTFNVTVEEVPSLDVTPESNLEINKDNEFDFVLSNTDKITASSLISNFNGGNIKIYKDGKELGSDELVGTGCVVKLINDSGVEVDSLTVVIKGDVDGDGVVGVTDARTVLRVAVELENFNANAPAKLAGDVDGDGSISVTEARTILRVAVGLENSFK